MSLISVMSILVLIFVLFFFFNDTATTEIYTLSLHDALPIWSRAPLVVMLRDESGYAQASWFHGAYLARVFERGQRLVLHGKVTRFKGAVVIQQPDYEIVESGDDERLHTGRLVPVYSLTEGLAQRALRALLWRIV